MRLHYQVKLVREIRFEMGGKRVLPSRATESGGTFDLDGEVPPIVPPSFFYI